MDRRPAISAKKSRDIERTIYTDWANHHLEKTGVKRLIQDLPKDIGDGLLLADIVHFVCEEPVDRIHANPSTAKQKIYNIERCLQILQTHKVVLNDVTALGLYRGELKSVLALFFHLSRFKQKSQDFKMADVAKAKRTGLRPPSAVSVSRKSRSFNANDKNRINVDAASNGSATRLSPTSPINVFNGVSPHSKISEPSAASPWRSKSMSAKHSATTRLLAPKAHAPTLQTFKPTMTSQSNPSSSAASVTSESSEMDTKQNSTRPTSPLRQQRTSHRAPNASRLEVRTKNVGIPQKSAIAKPVSRVAGNSPKRTLTPRSNLSKRPTEPPAKEPTTQKPASVMSRLKKLGSVTTATTTAPTSAKSRSTSASKNVTSVTSAAKKRAESCPPTSRIATTAIKRPTQLQQQKPTPEEKASTKKPGTSSARKPLGKSGTGLKGVKSSIGKAFSSKQTEKKSPKTQSPDSTSSKQGFMKKLSDSKCEKPRPTISDPIPIVTPDPIFGSMTPSKPPTPTAPTAPPTTQPLEGVEEHSKSEDPYEKPVEPVSISLGSPRVTNKPHKTATVAPFLRHPAKQSVPPTPPKRNSVTEDTDKKVQSTELTATTPEDARNKAVKGIADLRHNLEATMCSLRNTQLRHRKDDALQRRISAQLDGGEFDELSKTIPEIPSPSAAVYRSHHNLLSCRTSPRNSIISRSPKLHAGETLAQPREYRFEPGRFSSLQRTRSARYPRSAWRDVTAGYVSEGDVLATPENESKGYVSDGAILNDLESPQKHWDIPDSIDDASSVSSCDISDCIADVSTDELSSANNSPFRFNKQKDDRSGTISNEFSQSTMAIEGNKSQKTKKRGFGRPPTGKLGIKTPGSSVVGSRLACNTLSSSPAQSLLGQRGSLAYRSLPRPSKSNLTPDKNQHSPLTNGTLGRDNKGGETFKRSPSLQKLLGLASRKQSTCTTSSTISNPHVTFSQSSTYIEVTSSVTSSVTPLMTSSMTSPMASSYNSYTTPNKMELNSYNSLGRPRTASPRNGNISTSPLSYMSLPRRSSSRTPTMTSSGYHSNGCSNGMSTWSSPKRQNPNSAYSINPAENNPYSSMDLLTTPSLYLDDKNNDIYLDQDLRKKADDVAYGRSGVSDWPLPALLTTSSTLTSSSPNVSRAISLKSQETSKDFRQRQGSMFSLSERKQESHGNRPPSVISNAPSLYSLEEEGIEPMKLKLDSINGNGSIKNHLTTNAKVVSAFEESLSTMTNRLKELSATAVQKDSELQELRQTIENLKRNHSPDEWSGNQTNLKKKASCGSLSSISSKTSVSSIGSTEDGKRKKKHWLRDSIKTAFGKRKSRPNLAAEMEEMESIATIAIPEHMDDDDNETVAKLREELLQKERKLTDIRLEALTSQHQLHQMQDAMQRMRSEMETLRQENERLNKLGLSTMSLDMVSPSSEQRCIGSEPLRRIDHCDVRMRVMVEYPTHMTPDDTDERTHPSILGICYVPRSTGWRQLDEKVQLVFQEYCRKIDPIGGFGIHPDCVHAYTVGGAERVIGGEAPTLLPCGYIVGEVDTITLKLSELESVALDLLVDRDVLDRYTRLILEHGRVMICGPSGTGKSTLANRLAEHIVRNVPKRSTKCPVVHLDLKHTSENEIRDYLHGVSENCSKPESSGREVPAVIVFDNLHRSSAVNEAFHPLLTATTHTQLPYLIGVIQQGFASGLQLHHEFKWILCSNHTPPVHEYLTRALRRTLHSWELSNAVVADDSMVGIVKWLPQCWERVNNCIEAHSSADVTLGPRIFSSCPMDPHSSYTWFTDIWNFTIVPYVISAVRQRKLTTAPQWSDPLIWVKESWPWATPCDLLPIRVEDVSSDTSLAVSDNSTTVTTQSSDPLLNMLLRLQEAAAMNYESDTSHDDAFELSLDRALGDLA